VVEFKINGRTVKTVDEAEAFIWEFMQVTLSNPEESGYGKSYDFDLYLPWLMDWVLNRPHDPNAIMTPTDELELLYMEAGWSLVMKGLMRPGSRDSGGEIPGGAYGKGYAMTFKGRDFYKRKMRESAVVPGTEVPIEVPEGRPLERPDPA
jgi:hypothetical protein